MDQNFVLKELRGKKSVGPAWRPGPGSPCLAARSRGSLTVKSRGPLTGGQVQGAFASDIKPLTIYELFLIGLN